MLVLPMVLAIDTPITVKTLEEHRLSIIVREGGKLTSLKSFHQDTGSGEISVVASTSVDEIDLLLTLKKDGVVVLNDKDTFKNLPTGEPVIISFIPDENVEIVVEAEPEVVEAEPVVEPEPVVETPEPEVVEEPEPEVVEEKKKGRITGAVVSNTKAVISSRVTYYIIGGILIVFVGALVTRKVLRSKKGGKYLNFKKVTGKTMSDYEDELLDAEKKLKEAKEELDELRGRGKRLREARERVKRDKEELRKLEER